MKLFSAIFIVLLIGSYFTVTVKNSDKNLQSEWLIPELQDMINEVEGIKIQKEDKAITLSKEQGVWKIKEMSNYFADTNKVADLLLQLRKFKLSDKKTSNPSNYAQLSLAPEGNGAALMIQLRDKSTLVADISIGKSAKKGRGMYVRKNSESQTWLSTSSINPALNPSDWIVESLVDIDRDLIQSIKFVLNDKFKFTISKLTPSDNVFALVNNTVLQVKENSDLGNLTNGLQKININEALSLKEFENKKPQSIVTYSIFSGAIIVLETYINEDKFYLKIKEQNGSSQLSKQINNWIYQIPKFKFDALNPKIDDYFVKKK